MKKTIILSAIALSFTMGTLQANPSLETENELHVEAFMEASPFHLSIIKGDFTTVKKLLDLGANVNEKWNGLSPAMYAAKFNRAKILQLLIDHGASLTTKSKNGYTAKKYAKISKATEAMAVLEKALDK
jgi:ankyrin repeat protein